MQSKTRFPWLNLLGLVALVALGVTLGGMTFSPANATSVAALETNSVAAGEDHVEVFFSGIGNEDGRNQIKNDLNRWMRDNAAKFRVKGLAVVGDNRAATVIVWYEKK